MKKIKKRLIVVLSLAMILTGCRTERGTGAFDTDETELDITTVHYSEPAQPDETSSVSSDTASDTSKNTEQSSDSTQKEPSETISANIGEQIVQTAKSLIGIPFSVNGSTIETGFDNSGFIYYVLRENGFINCPRLVIEQAYMGTQIGYESLKKGDLAFFSNENSGKADFGGIYIGGGEMIYCPKPGKTVCVTDIRTEFWRKSFFNGVSLS